MSNPECDVLIPRIHLETLFDDAHVQFHRKQFPVSPNFAVTINKSVGSTFQRLGICMSFHECWTHGQLYVALSRASDGSQITYLVPPVLDTNDPDCSLKNVVFKEVLC